MLADALLGAAAIRPAASAPATTSVRNLMSPLRVEPVTDAAHGVDEARLSVCLQLLTDARNVNLERVGPGPCVRRPHRLGELGIGDEPAAVAHQSGQDPELETGEGELVPAPLGGPLAQVEGYVADHQARAAVAPVPPDHGLHPGHELLERERLGDVVVGSKFQAGDAVADRGAGADADQSRIRLGPEGLEQLGAGVVGEHEIEQDYVRVPLANQLQAAAGGVHGPHRVALVAEAGRHGARQPAVILHERDLPFHRHWDRRDFGTELVGTRTITRVGLRPFGLRWGPGPDFRRPSTSASPWWCWRSWLPCSARSWPPCGCPRPTCRTCRRASCATPARMES